jgi:isocitrate/isopropylmalate dehydrogenase
MKRRKHLTIVHKANVLRIGDGMFLDICRDVARGYSGLAVDDVLVDAMMAHVVRQPERFDVIVATNMFGDILSDLTAELSGSLGLGGSLNVGKDYAMAQAAHGSAPDIAGKDIANPISLILSMALLLAWHGERKGAVRFEGPRARSRTLSPPQSSRAASPGTSAERSARRRRARRSRRFCRDSLAGASRGSGHYRATSSHVGQARCSTGTSQAL